MDRILYHESLGEISYMNECERLELRLINLYVALGLKANWNLEKWPRVRRENKNLWRIGRIYKIMWERTYTCNKIKIHRWCETQVLIGWNFLVSHHDIKYNFVLTPCYQARFASLARFWHTRARLCINRVTKVAWACAACCLDTVWNPGLIAVRFAQRAHRLWPSVYQSETDVRTLNTSLTRENKFRSSRFGDFKGLASIFFLT